MSFGEWMAAKGREAAAQLLGRAGGRSAAGRRRRRKGLGVAARYAAEPLERRVMLSGVSFQAAVNYAAGSGPVSVASGDFNGDGKTDLAVANYYSDNVSVLLGNGNGTFQAAVNYAVGGYHTYPTSVTTGDFNGDGKADLAVAVNGGGVSVLLGNGNGTFQGAVNYGAGNHPYSVTTADFNGDGKTDLAVAGAANVSVLLGNSNGTFHASVIAAARQVNPAIRVLYHSDGNLTDLLPDLIEIGVTAINPVQAECMDLARTKREFGRRLVLWGCCAVQSTYARGSRQDVLDELRFLREEVAPGGGLVLQFTNLLMTPASLANLRVFFENYR